MTIMKQAIVQRLLARPFYMVIILALTTVCLLPSAFYPSVRAQNWGQGPPPVAGPVNSNPEILNKVGIDQRLDEQIPLDLVFRDEDGKEVRLGDYFKDKPVVLALVYYSCPMLCTQIMSGVTKAVDNIPSLSVGKDFEIVTVSFDARDTPELAREKKMTYLNWYKRAGAAAGWHFLTGDQPSIDRLTEAVGFHYAFDTKTNQFAHASGIMVLTPQGKLSRYFYGIEYAPRDLQLGLVEASNNKIGSLVDQLLLYCFHYDPTTGKYGFVIMSVIRLCGVLTIVGVAALVLIRKRRARRNQSLDGGMI